jgi:hypothetical protein
MTEAIFEQIPPRTVWAANADLYTEPDPHPGCKLDDFGAFLAYPLHDANGVENPLYNADGERVMRQTREVDEYGRSCGSLMDLTRITELFTADGVEQEPYTNPADFASNQAIYKYPIGGLRTAGAFQTSRSIPCFSPVIHALNQAIAMPDEDLPYDENEVDEDENGDLVPVLRPHLQAVFPVATQGYNLVQHSLAPRASEYVITHGHATASHIGIFSSTARQRGVWEKEKAFTRAKLPHRHLYDIINKDECEKAFRLEIVYVVHMDRIRPELRTGKYVERCCIELSELGD